MIVWEHSRYQGKSKLEKLIKTAMKHALDKLEVVDRTEFDIQSEALSKALAHVKELEKEITELKSKIDSLPSSDQEL